MFSAPGFTVTADRKHRMLRLVLSGFFEPGDLVRFGAAKQASHLQLRCEPNTHVTLVDVTACKIQPQPVVEAFAAMIADPRYRSRRIAFVTGSSLARMQVRRLLNGAPHARCFDDEAAAEAWLAERGSAKAA